MSGMKHQLISSTKLVAVFDGGVGRLERRYLIANTKMRAAMSSTKNPVIAHKEPYMASTSAAKVEADGGVRDQSSLMGRSTSWRPWYLSVLLWQRLWPRRQR